MVIRGYLWQFVAIRGYKKSSDLCDNALNLFVKPCHCVYLEVFSILQFKILIFDLMKAQYGQNM